MTEAGGVVLWGTGGQWHVRCDDGTTRTAALRGRVKHSADTKLAVGDRVTIESDDTGADWGITGVGPRRSELSRRNPGGARGERVIAANLDQVVVVMAMVSPEPNELMLDRLLVIVEANDLQPTIVVNKIDLSGEEAARQRFAPYEGLGYGVHYTSTRLPSTVDALHTAMGGLTSALTGPSGVGKSSIMNAMYPGLELRVADVSTSVNKGRHTTVGALMHPLPDGGFVVDTPGLREAGLWGINPRTLDLCFPEFRGALGSCRFPDCRHLTEPGCAVSALVGSSIHGSRYLSYRKLVAEAREADSLR
ncbi:MAG: ribosome small subunit-dependent GTPase A [Gemmatimonadota bacterium]